MFGLPLLAQIGVVLALVASLGGGAWAWLHAHDAALENQWATAQERVVNAAQISGLKAANAAIAATQADADKRYADLVATRQGIADAPTDAACADLSKRVLDGLYGPDARPGAGQAQHP